MKKLNQTGIAVLELILVIVVIAAIAGTGFAVMNRQKQSRNSETVNITPLNDHINPEDAEEIVKVDPADENTEEQEKIKDKTAKEAKIVEQPNQMEAKDANEQLKACPAKGGPNKITFYPSVNLPNLEFLYGHASDIYGLYFFANYWRCIGMKCVVVHR